jgi:hypothetical protein
MRKLLLFHQHFPKEVAVFFGTAHGFRMQDFQAEGGMRFAFPPYGY